MELQTSLGRRKRTRKIVVSSFLALLFLVAFACIGISVYVGFQLTHKERKLIVETPSDYGLSYENVEFASKDGKIALKGWIIEPEQKAKMTVIFSHGYGGNRHESNVPFLPIAKRLADEGYRIIMFDFRASGESDGEMITLGAKEKYDLLGVIDYAKQHYPEPIVLYGISMGAATSILAAGMSEDVKGIIADSPFSDLEGYLRTYMPVWTNLPNVPFTYLILTLIPMLTELDPSESVPIKALDDIAPRPILFIHSKDDPSIPYEESVKMYEKSRETSELWLTEKAGHVKSFEVYGDEYVERILAFLQKVQLTK
ncbi:alpha/beta hydrolase [Bacillus alveayuensis]|jgi:uncharacterized protein|uniref:alpha/beta hydrolase n=1 Tax=Aeribacillus alveayuensis TaxID=279215 RepID=UPI0005D10ADE|nr:alpha/beta fold hydrolase [Bacillus alveayuensis]